MEALSLLTRTFVIGVAVAAPVGAMGVLCIQRTLERGWRAGVVTGTGIATADAIYGALAAFGVAAVSAALVAAQTPLRLVGGAVLVFVGVRSMAQAGRRTADTAGSTDASPGVPAPKDSHVGLYASAVGLTLTNPMTIMAFGAIFAGAGLSAEPTVLAALLATLGVASGSLAWWLVLTSGVALARHGIGEQLVMWVTRGSGVVVAGFGLAAIGSALLG